MTTEKDVKDAVKEKKLLIGSRGVLSAAKTGKIISLIYASNTPRNTVSEITHYVNVSGIKVHEYPGNSVQLGELAGKPFSVLLLGIKK